MLFDKNKGVKDPLYLKIRDDSDFKEVRNRLEKLWQIYQPYADRKFKAGFREDLVARFWEMYVGSMLIQEGKELEKSGDIGPDICVKGSQKIWIEAVAPSQGCGKDKVPEMEGSGWVPEDKITLRVCHAIKEKFEKYQEYIEKGHISENDPYIIAINSSRVPGIDGGSDPPYIIRAAFPIGSLAVRVNPKTFEKIWEGYQYKGEIVKENKTPIETKIFLSPEYEGISAIIYSGVWPYDYPDKLGVRILLVHNPNAKNKIDRGWLATGREYFLEGQEIKHTDWYLLQS